MRKTFYKIKCQYKKNGIRIEPSQEYNFREFFSFNDETIMKSRFRISQEGRLFDLIPFDKSLHFAVSEKMRGIIENNHIQGLSFFPICIDSPVSIWGIVPTSNAGEIVNIERLNNLEDTSVEFFVSLWDGSDIFCLDNTLCLICTQTVKKILESNKITNITFEPCFGIL